MQYNVFVKKAGNLQFCIKSLYRLPQFLGFFCFPCEKPHTWGEGYYSAEYVRKGVRQSETAVGDDDKGAAHHCHKQGRNQGDYVRFFAER